MLTSENSSTTVALYYLSECSVPTIEVSDLVSAWLVDERERRPDQSYDDILRSLIGLPVRARSSSASAAKPSQHSVSPSVSVRSTARASVATRRLQSYISGNELVVGFVGAPERRWPLPPRNDKRRIRAVRDEAVSFVTQQGATIGQQNAVKKALTDAGFHLIK